MNGTPRGLNRTLLGLIGLVFMALGAALAILAMVPAAGHWWQDWSARALSGFNELAQRTHLFPGGGSWLWLVVAAALLLLAVCMLSWIANQGKGRAGILHQYAGSADDDGAAGKVLLSCAVAEQALKSALLERTDLLSVSVTSYDFRGLTSLRVRVRPRQGVAPHAVAADIAALVEAMDTLIGVAVPVLVSIGSGARSRFTKADRVR